MEPRMKKYGLSEDEAWKVLESCEDGVIATVDGDGSPYAVPVNHVCIGKRIYIHGRGAGRKLENILRDGRVSFTAYGIDGYDFESELACDTETVFRSAVVKGTASVVEDPVKKTEVLRALSDRFGREGCEIPPERVPKVCIVEIVPTEVTGKSNPWRTR